MDDGMSLEYSPSLLLRAGRECGHRGSCAEGRDPRRKERTPAGRNMFFRDALNQFMSSGDDGILAERKRGRIGRGRIVGCSVVRCWTVGAESSLCLGLVLTFCGGSSRGGKAAP